MRAIVTGGAGFIGSHVVEALLARGDALHVLDDLSKGKRENVAAGAELHVADIREPDEVFEAVRPQTVTPPPPHGAPLGATATGGRPGNTGTAATSYVRWCSRSVTKAASTTSAPESRHRCSSSTPPCRPPREWSVTPSSRPRASASCSAACSTSRSR